VIFCVNTVIPDRTVETAQGWVLYDGECRFCSGTAARFTPMLRSHQFDLAPLQTPWVQQRLGLHPDESLTEMKLLAADGLIYGGADAFVQIARRIWWTWPLYAVSLIPGVRILLRAIYQWIAARRNCADGICAVK
jgi:predicted DCC family thiol-disulfide oxidoreductase YuxK